MKQKLLLLLFLGLSSIQLLAQTRTVTGTVTGKEDGLPLPGLSVRIKGTQTGVQTNANGSYSIRLGEGENILQFTFIGYKTLEVSVGNRTKVDVQIEQDREQLSEVIVTGYGVEQKRDAAGAVSKITSSEIENLPVASFDRAMQGKMS